MTDSSRTFSDVWYRVARQTVTLRPRVEVRRQVFRGERWHVLYDPFNNQFFRVRPEAYAFIARLRPDRTVEEAWQETLDDDPETRCCLTVAPVACFLPDALSAGRRRFR